MNAGKKFELNFKASIPEQIYYQRLKDSAGVWQGRSDSVRFTPSNACDCILHFQGILFLCELKSHKGKSIPFSVFRESQLNELYKIIPRDAEMAVAIFNFRDLEETYLVHMADIKEFIETSIRNDTRKSFPIDWISEVGYIIPHQKKKVNYTYDILSTLHHVLHDTEQLHNETYSI